MERYKNEQDRERIEGQDMERLRNTHKKGEKYGETNNDKEWIIMTLWKEITRKNTVGRRINGQK